LWNSLVADAVFFLPWSATLWSVERDSESAALASAFALLA